MLGGLHSSDEGHDAYEYDDSAYREAEVLICPSIVLPRSVIVSMMICCCFLIG
jgi:hypothetical protein